MREWYCHTQDGTQFGPIEENDLVTLFHGGHLAPDALVWTEDLDEWVPAVDVEGLVPEEILAAYGSELTDDGIQDEPSPEQLEEEAKKCLDISQGEARYVVGPGCQIPLGASIENIKAFTQACHRLGAF